MHRDLIVSQVRVYERKKPESERSINQSIYTRQKVRTFWVTLLRLVYLMHIRHFLLDFFTMRQPSRVHNFPNEAGI